MFSGRLPINPEILSVVFVLYIMITLRDIEGRSLVFAVLHHTSTHTEHDLHTLHFVILIYDAMTCMNWSAVVPSTVRVSTGYRKYIFLL